MTKVLISFFIVFSISSQAQSDGLTELKMKEQILIAKISSLKDSLSLIQEDVAKIEAENFHELAGNSNTSMMIRKTAKLKTRPSVYGDVIKVFKSDIKVKHIESDGQYLKVETPYGIGYIHKTYLKKYNFSNVSRNYGRSRSYRRGPRGGCYYINSNGNKTYVARSKC